MYDFCHDEFLVAVVLMEVKGHMMMLFLVRSSLENMLRSKFVVRHNR